MTSWLFCTGPDGADRNEFRMSSAREPPPSSWIVHQSEKAQGLKYEAYLGFDPEVAWTQA